ncbi:MAG: sugar ABC transporter permease [Stappiaceae bacterium]
MRRETLIFCYAMVAPALIFTILLGIYPMLASIRISFLEYDLLRVHTTGTPWVGFENYLRVFNDPKFLQTVVNTGIFTVLAVSGVISLGLLLSQVLNEDYRGRSVVRLLVCVPWFVPPVVASAIWMWLLNTDRSPINYLLMHWGLIDSNIRFLTDREAWGPFSVPMLSVTAVRIWNGLPFVVIFLLAGLQSIPRSLYEAAEMDGASILQKFRYVTLPLLGPVLGVLLMLLVMTGLGHFEINYIMTGGGPQNLTNTMAIYSYQQAFQNWRFDTAAAASGLILILTGIVCIYYIRGQLKKDVR